MNDKTLPIVIIDRTCEETTGMIGEQYLRCGAPAVVLVKHKGRNEGPYFMCGPCANHNVRNRRAEPLLVAPDGERWVV